MSMKFEKTDKKNELKLEFTIEAEKFNEGIKKVFNKNSKYFNIPGFRKGKAPRKEIEKHYNGKRDKRSKKYSAKVQGRERKLRKKNC